MKFVFSCGVLLMLLFSCNSNKLDSKNPFAAYFYEVDSIPKIYLYRDDHWALMRLNYMYRR